MVVAQADGTGLDLSALHFRFNVRRADLQTPNTCDVRVYNVSNDTANRIQKEFTRIILQAGYENGSYGVIFDGNVKQVRRGRENATDTYLELLAADGDEAYNFATVSTTVAAGSTPAAHFSVLQSIMGDYGVQPGYIPQELTGPRLPRGKVMYGMCRDYMRVAAATLSATWSIQNGRLEIIPLTGYRPFEAVVLTAKTGLIGMPEQIQDGIKAKCLLNPNLIIGGKVQIDNKSVQQARIDMAYTAINFFPQIADDGFYRLLTVDHSGDTRGNDWYSDLICLGLDDTVPPSMAVKGFG